MNIIDKNGNDTGINTDDVIQYCFAAEAEQLYVVTKDGNIQLIEISKENVDSLGSIGFENASLPSLYISAKESLEPEKNATVSNAPSIRLDDVDDVLAILSRVQADPVEKMRRCIGDNKLLPIFDAAMKGMGSRNRPRKQTLEGLLNRGDLPIIRSFIYRIPFGRSASWTRNLEDIRADRARDDFYYILKDMVRTMADPEKRNQLVIPGATKQLMIEYFNAVKNGAQQTIRSSIENNFATFVRNKGFRGERDIRNLITNPDKPEESKKRAELTRKFFTKILMPVPLNFKSEKGNFRFNVVENIFRGGVNILYWAVTLPILGTAALWVAGGAGAIAATAYVARAAIKSNQDSKSSLDLTEAQQVKVVMDSAKEKGQTITPEQALQQARAKAAELRANQPEASEKQPFWTRTKLLVTTSALAAAGFVGWSLLKDKEPEKPEPAKATATATTSAAPAKQKIKSNAKPYIPPAEPARPSAPAGAPATDPKLDSLEKAIQKLEKDPTNLKLKLEVIKAVGDFGVDANKDSNLKSTPRGTELLEKAEKITKRDLGYVEPEAKNTSWVAQLRPNGKESFKDKIQRELQQTNQNTVTI